MKSFLNKHLRQLFMAGILAGSMLWTSCEDKYLYDDQEPEWLGASVYEYLANSGQFSNYVRIIEDLNYEEVLAKTGSKTLFVTPDSLFEHFYRDNAWGVRCYEDLTMSQKKLILNFSMINNSYLIETLSNYYSGGTFYEGWALRRMTALSVLDSVPYFAGSDLPASRYWDPWRSSGMFLLKDNTAMPVVHILQDYMNNVGLTDEDFRIITGKQRERDDAYIFGHKVIERDIVCKNGYVNVLDGVMVPPMNMAEYVRTNPSTAEFSALLDRFCGPVYSEGLTNQYNQLNPDHPIDSIFYMRYFAPEAQGGMSNYPLSVGGGMIPKERQLPFDPGWNRYNTQGAAMQSDMAVMFAPTNEALDYYLNEGSGRELKRRYGSWENVPDKILMILLKRHLRKSFQISIPSLFYKMVDEESSELPVKKSDLLNAQNYVAGNGVVYVTNEIYSPDAYVSVYGPVLFSEKTTVINWAIEKYMYNLYLNSMVSSYAFVAPTDKALSRYVDPFSYNTVHPSVLKFFYDPKTDAVKAAVFEYDKINDVVGDSVTTITDAGFIKNRLTKILDQSIVVGDFKKKGSSAADYTFEDGYYVTKDNNILFASHTEDLMSLKPTSLLMDVSGGSDMESNRSIHAVDSGVFYQKNGTSYMVDRLPQTPMQTVYSVLQDSAAYPEFSAFFDYCSHFPGTVFYTGPNYYGLDWNIRFFNNFRYTVYVPDNQAMQEAIDSGYLMSWEELDKIDETDHKLYLAVMDTMERRIRYHFQDNSVFIFDKQPVAQTRYYSATIKEDDDISYFRTYKNKFYRIQVEGDGTGLLLTTEFGQPGDAPYTAQVDVTSRTPSGRPYYNIMTRDYIFGTSAKLMTNLKSDSYKNSEITASATAVIHLVDKVLKFK